MTHYCWGKPWSSHWWECLSGVFTVSQYSCAFILYSSSKKVILWSPHLREGVFFNCNLFLWNPHLSLFEYIKSKDSKTIIIFKKIAMYNKSILKSPGNSFPASFHRICYLESKSISDFSKSWTLLTLISTCQARCTCWCNGNRTIFMRVINCSPDWIWGLPHEKELISGTKNMAKT